MRIQESIGNNGNGRRETGVKLAEAKVSWQYSGWMSNGPGAQGNTGQ